MKKFSLFLISLLFFSFFSVFTTGFAQTPTSVPLFNPSATRDFIPKNLPTPKVIRLLPFTTLTIQSGSFSDNIQVAVYSGNWDGIKSLIPQNQSPVSSYLITFFDSSGKAVSPSKPIHVESYDNYVKSTAFFYPVGANNQVDKANSKSFPGPLLLKTDLPTQDPAFIVAVNKALDKKDPSLSIPHVITTTSPSQPNQNSKGPLWSNYTILTLAALVIVAILTLLFIWKKDSNKPRRKVEGPSNIIVGGK